ncbi:MAG: hypothetical protein ACTHNP_09285 [Solirubrobacterales bacterium]
MEQAGPKKQPSKAKAGAKKQPAKAKGSAKKAKTPPATGDLPGWARPSAIAAIAIAVVIVVYLLASSGGGSSPTTTTEETTAAKTVKVVPESELLKAMKGVGYPVYWAGPRLGVEYEVQRLPGRVYVRYLPKGEKPETEKPFLTVGSYEQANALASIKKLGQQPGAILVKVAGGGFAYAEGTQATSAYMALPGVNVQIEVYEPQGGKALNLIRSGAIVPVS